jgi:hypothetical protein
VRIGVAEVLVTELLVAVRSEGDDPLPVVGRAGGLGGWLRLRDLVSEVGRARPGPPTTATTTGTGLVIAIPGSEAHTSPGVLFRAKASKHISLAPCSVEGRAGVVPGVVPAPLAQTNGRRSQMFLEIRLASANKSPG